jgi:UDP-GlcNAc:undecaprenyl-phosphate GlcNAc-1-phosphate transferase
MTFSSDFIAFIISLLLAASLTPFARRLAIVTNIVDKPGERRVHNAPVPLLGGLAIFAAFILTVILTLLSFLPSLSLWASFWPQ